jgi:N-methylhydantoinase A/oxoprolinase/acetone carboxylase beta subunit
VTRQGARLAVDIGGTFTDVVLQGAADVRTTAKVLTTPGAPADGVLEGVRQVLERAGVSAGDVALVLHGTTLATNALIERRGAVTALLTTEGHRDAVEMAFENRFEQYDVDIDRPAPLVPRPLRLPVPERIAADGAVLQPLDLDGVRRWLPLLHEGGVGSVAVGFLHSYVNPDHEQAVGALLREALPDVAVSLCLGGVPGDSRVRASVDHLRQCLCQTAHGPLPRKPGAAARRTRSDLPGAADDLRRRPHDPGHRRGVSHPPGRERPGRRGHAGGARGGRRRVRPVLSFDMGGTTAKICLIDHARPLLSRAFEVDRVYRFRKGSGLPVRIPVIEMVEIGAGGGSIASVDRLRRIAGRPGKRGLRAGSCVLRARRRSADGDRRRSAARPHSARALRRRHADPGSRGG